MIEDKTPMFLTLPGHILLNKNLKVADSLTYALIVALEPLREDREVTIEDVANILQTTTEQLQQSIRRLIKEEYLNPTSRGLKGYWN